MNRVTAADSGGGTHGFLLERESLWHPEAPALAGALERAQVYLSALTGG